MEIPNSRATAASVAPFARISRISRMAAACSLDTSGLPRQDPRRALTADHGVVRPFAYEAGERHEGPPRGQGDEGEADDDPQRVGAHGITRSPGRTVRPSGALRDAQAHTASSAPSTALWTS